MLYIRILGDPKNEEALHRFKALERMDERALQESTKKQFKNGKDFFFLSKNENDRFEIGALVGTFDQFEMKLNRFLSMIGLELDNIEYTEKISRICNDIYEVKSLDKIAKISRGASPRPIESYLTESKDGVNWIKIGDVGVG